jgi:O-antigen ligase
MSADLLWVPVLYRLGMLGIVVVAALFLAYGWRALSLSISGSGDAEMLALVFLGSLVGLFLEGFVSWTVLNPERYPLGLWLFAFAAAEACRRRQEAAELSAAPAEAEAPARPAAVAAVARSAEGRT